MHLLNGYFLCVLQTQRNYLGTGFRTKWKRIFAKKSYFFKFCAYQALLSNPLIIEHELCSDIEVNFTNDSLWPVLGNSVPNLGHEFLLLWLYFHSFSKNSCSQGSKNCGSCAKFLDFWNWNKIGPARAKFQAWVLRQKSPKPAIVGW